MSKHKSSNKSLRKEQALYQRNKAYRSKLRTVVKKVLQEVEVQNTEQAKTVFEQAVPVIDKICGKGIIHPNKAARHKSRLAKKINAMAAVAAA